MRIHLIPILKDNYVFLITGQQDECIVIDPGEAEPVLNYIAANDLTLTHILNTHHHWDHTDGNLEIKHKTGCTIVGPVYEPIRGIDTALSEGEQFQWQDLTFDVFHTPGHTQGHITYYVAALNAVFVGDVIFNMGCGRLFEGTPADAWDAFQKILALPDDTSMYCAHEYTLGNGKFALKHAPDNQEIQTRMDREKDKRRQGLPTIPSTLGLEKATNPFLRCVDVHEFAALRKMRDQR